MEQIGTNGFSVAQSLDSIIFSVPLRMEDCRKRARTVSASFFSSDLCLPTAMRASRFIYSSTCNDGEFRSNGYCSRNCLPTVLKASKSIRSSILVTIEGTSHRHHKIAESFHVDVAWF
jgi:hypothetical protein